MEAAGDTRRHEPTAPLLYAAMAELGLPLLLLEAAGRAGRAAGEGRGGDGSYTWCRRRHDFHSAWVRPALRQAGPACKMDDSDFAYDLVASHNECRARHGVAPLYHNPEISRFAQQWAETLVASGRLDHNPARFKGEQLGENMAMKWGGGADYAGREVTDQWYGEVLHHPYGREPTDMNTGHFSQVVWRGSREVGVGKARSPDGKVIVVVNYRPGGNVRGQFAANVLPPLDSASDYEPTTSSAPAHTRDTFQQRVEDLDHDFQRTSIIGQRELQDGESRSVRRRTVTEGSGKSQVTRVIEEETITRADGSQLVNIEETTMHPDGRRTVNRKQLRPDHGAPSAAAMATRTPDPKGTSMIGQRELQDGESRQVRTRTITEGAGRNQVTKVIQEETITSPDGVTTVNVEETTTHPDGRKTVTRRTTQTGNSGAQYQAAPPDSHGGGSKFGRLFGRGDKVKDKDKAKDKKKDRGRKSSSSSSSSDSSPERGKGKVKATDKVKAETMSDFVESCLKAHNSHRAKHGAPPLKHAKDLSAHAQTWAEKLASSNSFQHSACVLRGDRIGENIACKWASGAADYSGQEVADYWYGEVTKHDFRSDRPMSSGHFSQMVWKASKEVGFGKAKAAGGKVIVVANYRPAGNVMGQYRDNVAPAKK